MNTYPSGVSLISGILEPNASNPSAIISAHSTCPSALYFIMNILPFIVVSWIIIGSPFAVFSPGIVIVPITIPIPTYPVSTSFIYTVYPTPIGSADAFISFAHSIFPSTLYFSTTPAIIPSSTVISILSPFAVCVPSIVTLS